jgi:hypothetical protein
LSGNKKTKMINQYWVQSIFYRHESSIPFVDFFLPFRSTFMSIPLCHFATYSVTYFITTKSDMKEWKVFPFINFFHFALSLSSLE